MSSDTKIKKRAHERITSEEGYSSNDESFLDVLERAVEGKPKPPKKGKRAQLTPLNKRFSDPSSLELAELLDKADEIVAQDANVLTRFYENDRSRLQSFLNETIKDRVASWALADEWFKCIDPQASSERSLRKALLFMSWTIRQMYHNLTYEPARAAVPFPPEEMQSLTTGASSLTVSATV